MCPVSHEWIWVRPLSAWASLPVWWPRAVASLSCRAATIASSWKIKMQQLFLSFLLQIECFQHYIIMYTHCFSGMILWLQLHENCICQKRKKKISQIGKIVLEFILVNLLEFEIGWAVPLYNSDSVQLLQSLLEVAPCEVTSTECLENK